MTSNKPENGWIEEHWERDTQEKDIHQGTYSRILIEVQHGAVDIKVDQNPKVDLPDRALKVGDVKIFGKVDGSIIHYKEIW